MLEHVAFDLPAPAELTEAHLCRDMYHCLPSQLRAEPLLPILAHLTALRVETETTQLLGKNQ